ncbi:TetR/AcrR family transcriptional regulator [Parafrankia sp. EUN1f]|uniref:TetR/AcrR family transcriptional regulator n=1 Tax=Parafrankia sp. EUN1f TaxID=102897 RepID=UPI0001C44A1B|nr:TetR/AcrR family transcriptional regulator [Parafrankia sp. EUN1f]EFC85290.1 transcriptional regulator, TetR family [Parafrankia sp. EUN1f]
MSQPQGTPSSHVPGTPPGAMALRLLLTAERLFAEHGIDGVSLRQIAAQAGSANNSAVHYHFGSKSQLIEAIFAHRLPQLVQRRALLLARSDRDDLRARFEAQLLPVLELAESPDNFYVSFVEQLQRSEESGALAHSAEIQRSQQDFLEDMRRLLAHLDEPVRTMRIREVQELSVHAAARRERAIVAGEQVSPFGLFVSTLIDGFTGHLEAPMSPETRRFLLGTDQDQASSAMPLPML